MRGSLPTDPEWEQRLRSLVTDKRLSEKMRHDFFLMISCLDETREQLAQAQAACAEMKKVIELHHAWHLEAPVVYFQQDGAAIDMPTDLAEAYVESDLCEKTLPVFKSDFGEGFLSPDK